MPEDGAPEKSPQFLRRVELHFPRGSHQRVPVDDDDFLPLLFRDFFQPLAQFQFFRRKDFRIKTAHFPERNGFDEDERTRHPFLATAREIPQIRDDSGPEHFFVQPHRRTAGQTFAGTDLIRDFAEQARARMRIRIYKDQPVTGRRRCAAIARATDLIERLEHNFRAGGPGDFGSTVGGIIIANDEFKFPAALSESAGSGLNFRQRTREQFFFVESGHDHGDFHAANVTRFLGCGTILIVLFSPDDF